MTPTEFLLSEIDKREAQREKGTPGEWQPIETAPKDKTVLLWGPGYPADEDTPCCLGRWDEDRRFNETSKPYWNWCWRGSAWARKNQPTHWMPLPSAPDDASPVNDSPSLYATLRALCAAVNGDCCVYYDKCQECAPYRAILEAQAKAWGWQN